MYIDSAEYVRRAKELNEKAKALGHAPTFLEAREAYSAHCSCGWDSRPYSDAHSAYMEWKDHIGIIVEDPQGIMKPGEDLRRNR